MKLFTFLLVALASQVSGQQASSFTYGFGCGNYERPYEAALTYTGVPRLGSTVVVNYQSPTAPGYQIRTLGWLYTGASRDMWLAYQLPVWVGRVGAPASAVHCLIWASLDITTGYASGQPAGQLSLTIPPNQSLVGVQLFQQWLLISNYNGGGTTTTAWFWTNGGALTIGT